MRNIFSRSGLLVIFIVCFRNVSFSYDVDNDFEPGAFPGRTVVRTFSIPVEPGELLVLVPAAAVPYRDEMQSALAAKCGKTIPFVTADKARTEDLRGKHLIIVGGISDNRRALELYERRYAFADAYFPGKGGVLIHPAVSLWDAGRYVLVIGVSSDDDIKQGFETFLELLPDGARTIGPIHHLETSHAVPAPPESVEHIFENVRKEIGTARFPYNLIPRWGLLYFLTGDGKWAAHFRDGMRFLHERAEKTGKWIPEPWTNVYFVLWKMVLVWDLLDEDPFFTEEDRGLIDEVLWGYFNFCRGKPIPILEKEYCPPGEIRQNHSTFMALSLFYAHRYFTEKYGLTGLDDAAEKFERCFEGQALSYRPNDDASGYIVYAVTHLLNYRMASGDHSYLESGKLRDAASLIAATIDNRGDPVSFGDRGGYAHRKKGAPRGYEDRFLSMAAWYYGDGRFRWLHDWRTKDSVLNIENLFSGEYVADIPAKYPEGFAGIQPVFLDDASLDWAARRTGRSTWLPLEGERYVDKMAFRNGFDAADEYLLLDGISFLAHGHLDGNTVARLTWKDRVWLVDADYIKLTPQYHNGVVVVRDGVQEEPPPLTVLDFSADFGSFGVTRTTSRDFNGADWERNIVWKKGEYFLFLDRVRARTAGDFRLECRWRTLGDVELSGNVTTAVQGDAGFVIKGADTAFRRLVEQNEVKVVLAEKRIGMKPGDEWVFANLMYVTGGRAADSEALERIDGNTWMVSGGVGTRGIVGMKPEILARRGIYTDCGLFVLDESTLRLAGTGMLVFGDVSFEADGDVHLALDLRKGRGELRVPGEREVACRLKNIIVEGVLPGRRGEVHLKLAPGKYAVAFDPAAWDTRNILGPLSVSAHEIPPGREVFPRDFGLDPAAEYTLGEGITAVCESRGAVLCGTAGGRIVRVSDEGPVELAALPPNHRICCVASGDVNGDGAPEIIVGDDDETIRCFTESGGLVWERRMSRYFGPNADAVDVTVGKLDDTGGETILAATNGWKLYAFSPDGSVKWESFIYYHPLTKVRIFGNDGRKYVAVGTIYSTPLNVVDPADGKVLWFTWEQVGDEFLSTTDYCGFHLTDMVFVDTDLDGDREIVFGTKYDRIYALEASDGKTRWSVNVGDEVTVMRDFADRETGETKILAGTAAGDLVMLDRTGRELESASFGGGVSDIEVLDFEERNVNRFIVATTDGRIVVCDRGLRIRACFHRPGSAFRDIAAASESRGEVRFWCTAGKRVISLKYRPRFGTQSRFH